MKSRHHISALPAPVLSCTSCRSLEKSLFPTGPFLSVVLSQGKSFLYATLWAPVLKYALNLAVVNHYHPHCSIQGRDLHWSIITAHQLVPSISNLTLRILCYRGNRGTLPYSSCGTQCSCSNTANLSISLRKNPISSPWPLRPCMIQGPHCLPMDFLFL